MHLEISSARRTAGVRSRYSTGCGDNVDTYYNQKTQLPDRNEVNVIRNRLYDSLLYEQLQLSHL
jgi:hypothetical protein